MEPVDRPLTVSNLAFLAFANWGRRLSPQLLKVVQDGELAHHRHAAAAHLLRLRSLCDAIRLLGEAALVDEVAVLVRVMAELAITVAWVGKDDQRAWALARDQDHHTSVGDRRRKELLGVDTNRVPLADPARLPDLWSRAVRAGEDLERLYAAIYQWGSGPAHSALTVLGHLEEDSSSSYGRGMAALGVQAAAHLATYASANLELTDGLDEWQVAFSKWRDWRS